MQSPMWVERGGAEKTILHCTLELLQNKSLGVFSKI